jgi:UDP-glucuronate decarboxylase
VWLRSRACYDEGKRCGEALATAYASQYGVDVRIARIFNNLWPALARARRARCVQLHRAGARGKADYGLRRRRADEVVCYVSDLIEGLVRLMASEHGEAPVNLGIPRETSVIELARMIQEVGSAAAIQSAPRPADDPTRRNPDMSRALSLVSWQPTVTLETGLRATIDDCRRRRGQRRNIAAAPAANGVSDLLVADNRSTETSGGLES